jgi:hypothetical protein
MLLVVVAVVALVQLLAAAGVVEALVAGEVDAAGVVLMAVAPASRVSCM